MAGERILVVDDEANIVHTYAEILEREGFVVQGASTGLEAVECCRQEPYDLLLIDLKLPDIGGLEVMRQGKRLLPDAAAIITGFGTLESAVEALRLGAEEYLTKPIQSEMLVTTIQHILAQKRESTAMVRGNLRDISLTSLISITCNEHNQARLLIRRGNQEAALFFEGGNIVHITLNDGHEGEEVIYKVLGWEEGVFELEQGVPPPRHTVTTNWSALLLRGLQHLDESALETAERE